MKRLLLGLSLLLCTANVFSQTVNNVLIKDINVDYVQIVGTSKFLSTKVFVQIDFGQETKLFNRDNVIKDENGKILDFNSMIDALNFMTSHGYEFVQAYAFNVSNSQNVYHYLLKKRR